MLIPNLTIQPSNVTLATADPKPLMYVTASVVGALVLWVLYTILTAETRKSPLAAPKPKTSDDVPK